VHNDIMPHFIRQKGKTRQTVLWGGGGGGAGKGGGENCIKCKRNVLIYLQNIVQRTVQNVNN
jgi:hypothetical protein